MKIILEKLYKYFFCFIGCSAIVLYPITFIYSQNIEEISLLSLLPLAGKFLLVAFIAFAVFGGMTRSLARTFFLTVISLLFIMNFKRIEAVLSFIIPAIKYWHVLTVMAIILVYAYLKVRNEEIILSFSKVIVLVVWGLIAWNILPCIPAMIRQEQQIENTDSSSIAENTQMPNIYYLVFDEYSSINFMRKYYNYDNMPLATELEEKGFDVSYSSSNEAYATQICMTNILNMDFLFDMSMNNNAELTFQITEKRHNNLVFETLRANGYQIMGIGNPEFYGLPRIEGGNTSAGTTLEGKGVEQLMVEETVFYPFYIPNTSSKFLDIMRSVDFICSMEKPEQPTFLLFHIESTHAPFVVNKTGQPISGEHALDWANKEYYLGTYVYTNQLIERIVGAIQKQDPNGIILIQSDHSARAANSGYGNMFEDADKCQIFNAIYWNNNPLDIEGLSGINTMRLLFSQLFGLNYSMLNTYPLMEVS